MTTSEGIKYTVVSTENVFCNDSLAYEGILNWRGFSFEVSRLQTHREQRKAFALSIVDGGWLDDGRYGIAESDNIINNVVLKQGTYTKLKHRQKR